MTELENSIKTLTEHTQHYVPTEDLAHLYAVIEAAEKLIEYKKTEEEGRLKIFPCKVGDTLFVLTPDSPTGIETTKCIRLSIDKRRIIIQAPSVYDDWGNAKWNFKPTDFGKKVFLDFEEAKRSLKEIK